MKCKYTVSFSVICPSDKEVINYKAIIETNRMIMVEDINDYVFRLKDLEIFQEGLTKKLKDELTIASEEDIKITTFGTHQGVDIECVIE